MSASATQGGQSYKYSPRQIEITQCE